MNERTNEHRQAAVDERLRQQPIQAPTPNPTSCPCCWTAPSPASVACQQYHCICTHRHIHVHGASDRNEPKRFCHSYKIDPILIEFGR